MNLTPYKIKLLVLGNLAFFSILFSLTSIWGFFLILLSASLYTKILWDENNPFVLPDSESFDIDSPWYIAWSWISSLLVSACVICFVVAIIEISGENLNVAITIIAIVSFFVSLVFLKRK